MLPGTTECVAHFLAFQRPKTQLDGCFPWLTFVAHLCPLYRAEQEDNGQERKHIAPSLGSASQSLKTPSGASKHKSGHLIGSRSTSATWRKGWDLNPRQA
jgi:hypothetical protein